MNASPDLQSALNKLRGVALLAGLAGSAACVAGFAYFPRAILSRPTWWPISSGWASLWEAWPLPCCTI